MLSWRNKKDISIFWMKKVPYLLLCFVLFPELYPLSKVRPPEDPTYPINLPYVAWNPWADLRRRDDVNRLNVSFPFGPLPYDFSQLMRQSYYAATSYMDNEVGRLLSALEQYGFANSTIIAFLGDHGEIINP